MRFAVTGGIAALVWVSLLNLASVGQEPAPAATTKSDLQKLLELALQQEAASREPAEKRRLLLDAVLGGLSAAGENIQVRERFEQATSDEKSATDERKSIELLRQSVRESLEDLAFRPRLEAKLPAGFPEPTPVGEIQVKQYPIYRMARTQLSSGDNNAFMTLFFHIKNNDIEMTAPVEMTYSEQPGQTKQRTAMAFLYQNTDLGTPGQGAKVDVLDAPAMVAVSIGLRGDASPAAVEQARTRLTRWLTVHADRYRAAGPLRLMGYNSPFVPSSRRYCEVQIPIQEHTGKP